MGNQDRNEKKRTNLNKHKDNFNSKIFILLKGKTYNSTPNKGQKAPLSKI
ncbi:MAG TPA: hypothetical protein PKD96_02160 [Candidatus Absconditabacterales bacterium]|nr:hypothetical protein [Candidatus Absconditabacterales bacterium]